MYLFGGFPDSSVGKESTCNSGDPGLIPGWRRCTGERDRIPIPVFLGFSCGSAGKESAYNVGDLGSIPGLDRSLGEGKGYPLQYSFLENSIDCRVHGVTKSWTLLNDFHFMLSVWFSLPLSSKFGTLFWILSIPSFLWGSLYPCPHYPHLCLSSGSICYMCLFSYFL